jgi:hypothetical protein
MILCVTYARRLLTFTSSQFLRNTSSRCAAASGHCLLDSRLSAVSSLYRPEAAMTTHKVPTSCRIHYSTCRIAHHSLVNGAEHDCHGRHAERCASAAGPQGHQACCRRIKVARRLLAQAVQAREEARTILQPTRHHLHDRLQHSHVGMMAGNSGLGSASCPGEGRSAHNLLAHTA